MRDFDIESDLKQEKFQSLKLVQGDRGNKIKINVYEDGQPVNLTGCSIAAKYKRSDGEIVNGTVENISGNSFDAVMDSDITKASGTLKMIFTIEKDDVKVSTFLLLADVREGIGENTGSSGGSTGGGSTSEVTIDLSQYYKKTETYSKAQIDSQFKDIANNQPTDLSLDSATNLLQLVNSKGSKLGKGITLPISSGGSTSQYLHIKYSSTGAPQLAGQMSDTPNAYIGLSVDTNADSPTNPRSYTWYKWKGDNGAKGDTGATPNLQIGTVTTLESGSSATASIAGTTENPLLNLGIPKGNSGTGGSEKEWEYIETIETAEEVKSVVKNFDKEYSELYIKMFVENNTEATGTLSFKINNKLIYTTNTTPYNVTIGKIGSGTRELLVINSISPLIFYTVNSIATNTWGVTPVVPLNSDTHEDSRFSIGEKISKIEIYASNSQTTFATGARFIIYGK